MTYQLPRVFPEPHKFEYDLSNAEVFLKGMTKPAYYIHFLQFFKREIASKGMGEVVKEYVFKGDERANRILTRLYDGVLHGLMHVGYAFEFEQPLILAEALAEAAITTEYLDRIIDDVVAYKENNKTVPDSDLMSIYPRLRADPTIFHAVRSTDGRNKLRDGLIARAKQNMIPYLAEFSVKPLQIKRKTAELANTALFVAAAAQKPQKVEMIDFFLLHSVNSSIWMSVLIEQNWMTDEAKCRLLEIKGWTDLITYACCRVPTLYPERIFNYTPKQPGHWETVYRRAVVYNDDGHVPKFIRAARYVEQVSKEYAGQPEFPLQPELCLTIAHMAMDSVDRQNEPGYRLPGEAKFYDMANMEVQRLIFRFVRFGGLDDAWDHVPDIATSPNL
ncbi:hypothetical protein EIK77_007521 [Talaromyces pinophilus]|nr:hypothetical protein EIK77_007521 [Talaromyces pinophilus]